MKPLDKNYRGYGVALELSKKYGNRSKIEPEDVSPEYTTRIMRCIVMESGLSLYDELIANMVASNLEVDLETIIGLMNRELDQKDYPEFQENEFLSNFSRAADNLDIRASNTTLMKNYRRYRRVADRVKRFEQCIDNSFEEDEVKNLTENFVAAMEYLDTIVTHKSIGDVEKAVIDALIFNIPVDLLVIKCARMAQYRDQEGRNRLDILTGIDEERRISIDGAKTYPSDDEFISGIEDFVDGLRKCNVLVRPVILIADDDVENMYPNPDLAVVPYKDVLCASDKCVQYSRSLDKAFGDIDTFCDAGYIVGRLTDVASGTGYSEVKETAMNHLLRYNRYGPVGDSYYEALVADDVARYASRYEGYGGEVSKHKIAGKIGGMLGLAEVTNQFENPVFLTEHNNVVEGLMGQKVNRRGQLVRSYRRIVFMRL
jgi:hypothetical protein